MYYLYSYYNIFYFIFNLFVNILYIYVFKLTIYNNHYNNDTIYLLKSHTHILNTIKIADTNVYIKIL